MDRACIEARPAAARGGPRPTRPTVFALAALLLAAPTAAQQVGVQLLAGRSVHHDVPDPHGIDLHASVPLPFRFAVKGWLAWQSGSRSETGTTCAVYWPAEGCVQEPLSRASTIRSYGLDLVWTSPEILGVRFTIEGGRSRHRTDVEIVGDSTGRVHRPVAGMEEVGGRTWALGVELPVKWGVALTVGLRRSAYGFHGRVEDAWGLAGPQRVTVMGIGLAYRL